MSNEKGPSGEGTVPLSEKVVHLYRHFEQVEHWPYGVEEFSVALEKLWQQQVTSGRNLANATRDDALAFFAGMSQEAIIEFQNRISGWRGVSKEFAQVLEEQTTGEYQRSSTSASFSFEEPLTWPEDDISFRSALFVRAGVTMSPRRSLPNATADDARAFFTGMPPEMINDVARRLPDGFQVSQDFVDVLKELATVPVNMQGHPLAGDGEVTYDSPLFSNEGYLYDPNTMTRGVVDAAVAGAEMTNVQPPKEQRERWDTPLSYDELQTVHTITGELFQHAVDTLEAVGLDEEPFSGDEDPATWPDKRLVSFLQKDLKRGGDGKIVTHAKDGTPLFPVALGQETRYFETYVQAYKVLELRIKERKPLAGGE